MRIELVGLALLACWACQPRSASAYVSFGNGYGSKWGPPEFGSAGVATWGYMLDGTGVDPAFRMDPWGFPDSTGLSGNSRIGELRARVDNESGAGAFDAAIQRALNTWSSVANIQFVGPVADDGKPFAAIGAISPDIRIGAFK